MTVMWTSPKASAVEETSSSTEVETENESSDNTEASKIPLESTIAVNPDGDMNNDDGINSMMNEAISTGEGADDESEEDNLMQQIKDSGVAGVISYAAWELAFWTISVPVCVFGYKEVTGHWPDFNDKEDLSKLGAEAFAFVNFARFAVPLRIGLALGTTPWIQENIVDIFLSDEESKDDSEEITVKESKEGNAPEEEIVLDGTVNVQSTEEGNDADKITSGGSRFRIRARLRNLMNRVLRRSNESQGEGKE